MGCAKSKIQQQQQMTQTAASASTLDTVSTAATLLQQQPRGSTSTTTTTKRPATLFTCDEHEQSMFHLPPELAFAATHHCTTSAPPTTLMQQQTHRRRNSADVSASNDDDSAFSPVNNNGLPQSNTFTSLASLYSNGSSSAASSLLMHSPTSSSLCSPTASLSPKSLRPATEQADPACVDAAASHIHSMLRRRGTWELRVARAQEEGAPHELARQATHVMMGKLPTEQQSAHPHHVLALISGHEVADRAAPADVADEGDPIEVTEDAEDDELPRLRRQDSYLLALTESPALHVEPEIARIGDLFGRIDEWIGEVVLPTGVSALDYAVRQVATDAVLQQQQRKKHANSVINSPKLMPYVGEVVLSVPAVSF